MSNVLEMFPDKSGYIVNVDKIEGVYNQDLAAWFDGGSVFVGEKSEQGVENPVEISIDDLNTFCIMWLAIYKPDALACEDE